MLCVRDVNKSDNIMGTAMYRLYEAGLALEFIIIGIMVIVYIKNRNSRILTIVIILTISIGIDIAPLVFYYSQFILTDYISSMIKWLARNEWQMYGYRQGVSAVELIIVGTLFIVFLTFMILVKAHPVVPGSSTYRGRRAKSETGLGFQFSGALSRPSACR